MKRWMAFLLAGVMMLASCMGAYAQTYTAEDLIAELLQVAAEQLQHPSLGLTYSDGQTQAGLSAALDANGVPDVAIDYAADGLKMRLDADAAGVRFDDGAMKIGAAPDSVLRALFVNEDGACLMPSVTQMDLDWMAQMAGEAMAAAAGTIEVERFAAEKDPAAAAADAPAADAPAADEQTTVVIDVNGLLAALDAAVPVLLTKYASQIDDFTARNSALLCELFGVNAIPKAEALSGLWPAGLLSSLLPEDIPLMVTVMAGPGEACGIAVLGGEEELLLVSYGEGRLVAQLGGGDEALLLDSEDLWDVLALFMEASEYVSAEAYAWHCAEDAQGMHVSFHLDPNRLVHDLIDGLAAAMQNHEAMISALLERYMPWLEAAGAYGARGVTWEMLTQALLEERDALAMNLCWDIARQLGISYYALSARQSLPVMDLEFVLPKDVSHGGTGSLSASVGTVRLHAALSRQHLNATLHLGDNRMTRFELLGLLGEDGGRLTLGRYNRSRLEAEVALDVRLEGDTVLAWLRDQDGTELASFHMDGGTACLTSGELVIEAVDTSSGLVITGSNGTDRFGGQIVADGRMISVSGYMNGANAQLQIVSDAKGFSLTGAYAPQNAPISYRTEMKLADNSLSLCTGEYRGGLMSRGVETDASVVKGGIQLNFAVLGRNTKTQLAYRPGLLEIDCSQKRQDWNLRVADMTGRIEDAVRVKIDWEGSIKRGEEWEAFDRAWTITAIPENSTCKFEIEGILDRPVYLTLDFAAKAQAEDLTGYTWYNEAELAQMLRALLAPQPVPTPAAETTTDPAAQPAAAQ